jgi:nucleoside-diphosphate-sugar epimerase
MRAAPPVTVVTGAAGWLGRALVSALAGEDEIGAREGSIRALVLRPADVPAVAELSPRVEVHVGDAADSGVLQRVLRGAEGADVFHCAAVIHPRRTGDFEHTNVEATRAVLSAAADAGVRRVVHVSSNSPFGFNPTPEDVFRAEEPFNPYLGYGHSKMRAELLVRSRDGGPETVVVRPPWFYGPFQPERQTRFLSAVRTGRFPLFGDGSNRRSMVFIGNLVQGLVLAELVEAAAGRAYWIADARPYPMREILDTVCRALEEEGYEVSGRPPRLPAPIAELAGRADALVQRTGRYVQELHVLGEMHGTIACDISRSEQELGYSPKVELLEGMRSALRWCRERGIAL